MNHQMLELQLIEELRTESTSHSSETTFKVNHVILLRGLVT